MRYSSSRLLKNAQTWQGVPSSEPARQIGRLFSLEDLPRNLTYHRATGRYGVESRAEGEFAEMLKKVNGCRARAPSRKSWLWSAAWQVPRLLTSWARASPLMEGLLHSR